MEDKPPIRRQSWYARLLRLYPKPYYDRFHEEMEQTFADLCRARGQTQSDLSGLTLWILLETSAAILMEWLTNKNLQRIVGRLALVTAAILMIPLVAMQFTKEVNWTFMDFAFAGTLIFGTGLLFELARKRAAATSAYKIAAGLALAAGFLLTWINAAVGIIGDERNPANLMYLVIVVIGIIGMFLARFRPAGMARTLFLMSAAQLLIPLVALAIADRHITSEPPGLAGVIVVNAAFATLFLGSGFLFRRAAHKSH